MQLACQQLKNGMSPLAKQLVYKLHDNVLSGGNSAGHIFAFHFFQPFTVLFQHDTTILSVLMHLRQFELLCDKYINSTCRVILVAVITRGKKDSSFLNQLCALSNSDLLLEFRFDISAQSSTVPSFFFFHNSLVGLSAGFVTECFAFASVITGHLSFLVFSFVFFANSFWVHLVLLEQSPALP